jgi:hypothetical protein
VKLLEFLLIGGAEIDAIDYDLPGLRPRQTDNLAEKRTLAGPASSQEDHGFPRADFEGTSAGQICWFECNDMGGCTSFLPLAYPGRGYEAPGIRMGRKQSSVEFADTPGDFHRVAGSVFEGLYGE